MRTFNLVVIVPARDGFKARRPQKNNDSMFVSADRVYSKKMIITHMVLTPAPTHTHTHKHTTRTELATLTHQINTVILDYCEAV